MKLMFVKTVAHAKSVKTEVLKPRTEVVFFSAEGFGINVVGVEDVKIAKNVLLTLINYPDVNNMN